MILEMPVAANTTLATLARRLAVRHSRLPPRTRDGAPGWSSSSESKRRRSKRRRATFPAATSRKWRWRGGWPLAPAVLILDEPTQGVDVGAKAEIHRLMSELAAAGLAILMISSELPEILGMSDRIAVMHGGSDRRDARTATATQELILELALGHVALREPLHDRPISPRALGGAALIVLLLARAGGGGPAVLRARPASHVRRQQRRCWWPPWG